MKGHKTNGRHGTAPRSNGRPGGRPGTSLWMCCETITLVCLWIVLDV